eukprot:gb/GFBE01043800.1/.p1 GENE.gb/GFBE01043800.1/~~gb/GFBE01043800.1/.p1  ORF type:complete len:512 (+),score=49.34 gb/GFBE01043800.1/:1-1536(+)
MQLPSDAAPALKPRMPQSQGSAQNPWRPTGLYRNSVHGSSSTSFGDESIAASRTSLGLASGSSSSSRIPAIPTYNPYESGWLLQPPSGHWILDNGRPKCVRPHSGLQRGMLPRAAGKSKQSRCDNSYQTQVQQQHQSEQRSLYSRMVEQQHQQAPTPPPEPEHQLQQPEGMPGGTEDVAESVGAAPLPRISDSNRPMSLLAASCVKQRDPAPHQQSKDDAGTGGNHQEAPQVDATAAVRAPEATEVPPPVHEFEDILHPMDKHDGPQELRRFDWKDTASKLTTKLAFRSFISQPPEAPPAPSKPAVGPRGSTLALLKNFVRPGLAFGRKSVRGSTLGAIRKSTFGIGGGAPIPKKPSQPAAKSGGGNANVPKVVFATSGTRSRSSSSESLDSSHLGSLPVIPGTPRSPSKGAAFADGPLKSSKASYLEEQRRKKRQRDMRSELKKLRENLLVSAKSTFKDEVWTECGIDSDHLNRSKIQFFLGGLARTGDDAQESSTKGLPSLEEVEGDDL